MRWADERYVRLYTRNTPDWLCLPWQSRALMPLLLRVADRAGQIGLGRAGVPGLAQLVGLPEDVTEAGLNGLLRDCSLVLTGQLLTIPNFIDAQEVAISDKQRKREQRERDRAKALETQQQAVTDSHTSSQSVTPNRAVPSLTVPIEDQRLSSAKADALAVLEAYKLTLNKPKARLTAGKTRMVKSLLAAGHTVADLCEVPKGCLNDPWPERVNHNSFEIIFRPENVEKFIDLAINGPPKPQVSLTDLRTKPVRAEDMDWSNVPLGRVS